MMGSGRMAGKVAFITGAGRGQGRSHAVRLAEEGADVIAVDLSEQASKDVSRFSPYPMATEADLEETARLVAAAGGRVMTCHGDVRDQDSLDAAVAAGLREFGRIDIVSANAGIGGFYRSAWEFSREEWQAVIDVDLTGIWQTAKAVAPAMISQGGEEDTVEAFQSLNLLPVPWNEARDVSEAVLWLASDQARHVTGIVLPIDAGQLAKITGQAQGSGRRAPDVEPRTRGPGAGRARPAPAHAGRARAAPDQR
jgi:NAD(P)-dependent dehydrogenase (short-subunit alcohol dehydrogenase family)